MQKRKAAMLAGGFALAFAAGYPAASWYVGKQAQARLDAAYKTLQDSAQTITVSDRRYERGLFSSTETLTLGLRLGPQKPAVPLFTVSSRIRHLPLSGLFTLSTVAMDSEVNFAENLAPAAAEWTGGQTLAKIHTSLGLGRGSSTLTIPPFNTARLSTEAATLKVNFAGDFANAVTQGSAPRIGIIAPDGTRMDLAGIRLDADTQRIHPDMPGLFGGTTRLTIAQLESGGRANAGASAIVKNMSVEAVISPRDGGEFIDYTIKSAIASITAAGKQFGPMQLDLSLRHLHSRSLASLSQMSQGVTGENAAQADQLIETLLTRNPEFSLDRLSFTLPEGETVLSAQASLRDMQPGEIKDKEIFLRKGYARVDVQTPEKIFQGVAPFLFGMFLHQPMDAAMLENLIAAGYISRDSGNLKTRFEYRDAQSWLNGKQYAAPNPATHAAPGGMRLR